MKLLSACVALFGLLALVQPVIEMNFSDALLGVVALLSAVTTFRSTAISTISGRPRFAVAQTRGRHLTV